MQKIINQKQVRRKYRKNERKKKITTCMNINKNYKNIVGFLLKF
jgi:hypothetical protein